MSKTILSTVASLIEGGKTAVAPSEVVAADWRRRVLMEGGVGALLEERVVSWDRFKETTFGLTTERRPVNGSHRLLFVDDLLRRNRDTPLFEGIINPAVASDAGGVGKALLRFIPALSRTPDGPFADPALRDVLVLKEEYRRFLDNHGLFEPNWLHPSSATPTSESVLLLPDLMEDFSRFSQATKGVSDIGYEWLEDFDDQRPVFGLYPTTLAEVRAIARRLSGLLDRGVHPSDIAITVAGWSQAYPYVARECRRYDVPLSPRRGLRLSDSPGARIFPLLRRVVDRSFELTAVESLLGEPSIPWRRDLPVGELLLRGREGRCFGRFGPPGSPLDLWAEGLRNSHADIETQQLARRLFRLLKDVRHAENLSDLRTAVFRLLNGYVDRDRWSPEALPALERSLELLGGLVEAARFVGREPTDPFGMWDDAMAATMYVRRATETAIPVYDYRVTAGITPPWHFVVNAHHAATRVSIDPLRGLRPDQKATLGLDPVSLSNRFLHAYALSGATVCISGSSEGISERQMVPDWFEDRVQQAEAAEGVNGDAYRDEERYFAGTGTAPRRVWSVQVDGARRYARTEGPGAWGGAVAGIDGNPLLHSRLRSEEGALLMSASRLRSYLSCPQRFFLGYILGLEEGESGSIPQAITPQDEGSIAHRVLRSFHQELADSGGTMANLAALNDETVEKRVQEVAGIPTGRDPPIPAILHPVLARRLKEGVARAIQWECEKFPNGRPVYVEENLAAFVDDRVLLRGGVDLSLATGATDHADLVLIDFKRSSIPRKSALGWINNTEEEIERLASGAWAGDSTDIQLPVYILLAQADGRAVAEGWFYSLRKQDQTRPFPATGGIDAEGLSHALRHVIALVAENIDAGMFDIPRTGAGCASCGYRSVCRAKFVAEERRE